MHRTQPRQSLREVFSDPVMRVGAVLTIAIFVLTYSWAAYVIIGPKPITYETWCTGRIESIEQQANHVVLRYDNGTNAAILPTDNYEYQLGKVYWLTVKLQGDSVLEILNREEK